MRDADELDPLASMRVRRPIAVYSAQVYAYADLNLGI
jgi:hypothetical protein